MEVERWTIVKELLQDVMELPRNERSDFLARNSPDEDIRAEVESLMVLEDEVDGSALGLNAAKLAQGFVEGSDAEMIGAEIGSYRIIREIGYGGMGAVYLAERIDGKFEQRVALKMLKREMNTGHLRRRFDQEREILASLEHPNIARLLDSGTTPDDVPFLAMEYVDGLPIDKYCSVNDVSINGRLELFRLVCLAVEFAHANLIVHRDLKPSNILVTDSGIPKLLDFGISKILGAEYQNPEIATVTRIGVMTPSYASPEQLQRKTVTTSTDIYSLGVILYELLCGHRPFEHKEFDIREMYSAVLETDPQLPSAVLAASSEKFRELASARTAIIDSDVQADDKNATRSDHVKHTGDVRLRLNPTSLRGDLDNIVLKALRKEPERRYSSVAALSEDIKRHLAGLPVTARPNTFGYRAEKFVQRHRLGVMGGAVLATAITGGVATTFWQANIANIERARAEKRFDDVRALANSFIYEFSPLIENVAGTMPARKLLVTRAKEYLDGLSAEAGDDPMFKEELARAYEKVGDLQGNPYNPNVGDVEGALSSYSRSLELRESILARDPSSIEAKRNIASVLGRIGDIESNGGSYEKAAPLYERALEYRKEAVDADPSNFEARSDLAEMLRVRGLLYFFDGNNKKAIEYYRQSMAICEALKNERPDDPAAARSYAYSFVAIGEAQGWDNEFELGGENLQKGLDLLIPLAARFSDNARIQRSLMLAYQKRAENYEDLEDMKLSVPLYEKGAEIAEKRLLSEPGSFQAKRDVAMGNKKLAQILIKAGRGAESLAKMNIALDQFRQLVDLDPNNKEAYYDVANTRHSVGTTLFLLKRYAEALDVFAAADREFEKVMRMNPANTYAIRMRSINYEYTGNSYRELAQGPASKPEHLRNAIESYRAALNGFKKMEEEGHFNEVDRPKLEKISGMINDLEKQMR